MTNYVDALRGGASFFAASDAVQRGEPLDDPILRQAQGPRRGGGAQRVAQIMPPKQAQAYPGLPARVG